MSLSTVINDLEAEGCETVTTYCFITSKSVTQRTKATLLQTLIDSDEDLLALKVIGTTTGLALCDPSSDASEVALTACACGGNIIFYPDAIDLSRQEGLFDGLGPALEKLLSTSTSSSSTSSLLVVVQNAQDKERTKASLEQAAETVLSSVIQHHKHSSSNNNINKQESHADASLLQDVFDNVQYVTPQEAAVVLAQTTSSISPVQAAARVADTVDLETMLWTSLPPIMTTTSSLSANDLAAARMLGPKARVLLLQAIQQVKQACVGQDGSSMVFVPTFGELCKVAMDQAVAGLEKEVEDSPAILNAAFGKQIRSNLLSELDAELGDLFIGQLDLLQEACFDECKKGISKLLVSPNLGNDMQGVASKSVSDFAKRAKKLIAKGSSWTAQPAKKQYQTRLKDFCTTRLQAAEASGQYRPLPRKGVTIGLHWLLPKPFGNDFRQEPWMVHASDNMVYVPKDKITDLSPEDVAAGDWRDKIVPSPAGNDMLYMQ